MANNKKIKALLLLSGGLDSILAAKLLMEQRIEVVAINFRTNFCGPSKARPAAQMLGIPLREVAIREEFLDVLKKPKHGYGAGLNPCIDCHALMLKKAAEIMASEEFDFVATGEVLGERPMSQHKQALEIVEKEAGLKGYLLRPLCAKLLEPTVPEKDGRVDREKLLGISGRNRKPQMELVAKYGIKEYPTPAGGCALTQEGFAKRLKELMTHKPDFNSQDVDLVRFGRHFWINMDTLRQAQGINILLPERSEAKSNVYFQIILGRNEQENEILKSAAKKDDTLVTFDALEGPTALVRQGGAAAIATAKELMIKHTRKARNSPSAGLSFKVTNAN